ncbi:hypothetical protein RUM43_005684 [Polyplax serrata]|uniref:mRNA export factor GLE1 n=1 Tax=Polyplax serrata TaxID=468196 RepID=A0AAN8NWG9_POLSC
MFESVNLKKVPDTYRMSTSFDGSNKKNQNCLPSILKRKCPKSVYSPSQKRNSVSQLVDSEMIPLRINRVKFVSTSHAFIKVSNRYLTSDLENKYEEGDRRYLKKLNSVKKKPKRVTFADSNDIIGSDNNTDDIELELQPNVEQVKSFDSAVVVPEQPKPLTINLSDCYDVRSYNTYIRLKSKLENFEKSILPLATDEAMKKFKFNCQKAVTIPVNAISPVSAAHLVDKYTKLNYLLAGKPVEVGDIKLNASQHPLGIAFCKNLLAKKFVRQGDLTVSSKPDAAFSLAAVLTSLWVDFPDFGQLVLAHFHLACPYLAPVFIPQVEGQSDEDYHKALGYHYSHNGEVEKQDSFLKRMSGIMRLYAALIISKPRQPGKINPLGLSEGWRWISALLNLDPRPDICATLLYDFLEVAGNDMFKVYGGQFRKLLAYICQEYFPKLEKVTPSSAGGPIVRLEGFLQKILKEESIPPPQGILPLNFW